MTRNFILLFICSSLLAGCAVRIPDPSPYKGLQAPQATVEDTQLLDVAIEQFVFEPVLLDDGSADVRLTAIRDAESRYLPVMLQYTLIQAQAWGQVHVVPQSGHGHEVRVEGSILESSAHTLQLQIRVLDATGAVWFDKIYTENVGDGVYGDESLGVNDPFDSLYNRVANDMLAHAQGSLDAPALATIRQVAELEFGNEFAPDLYADYLVTDAEGIRSVTRMPPPNDPAVRHLNEIRQRDRAFHEALQQHYFDFAREISNNYFEYRRQSFILATIAAATTGVVGSVKLVVGVRDYTTASPLLDEISDSFAGDVVTDLVELDQQVVTLSGSTEEIYRQWKEILRDLFREDRSL